MVEGEGNPPHGYAMQVANDSYDWYKKAAIKSRIFHRWTAVTIQVIAAAIPVTAAIDPRSSIVPAFLGAVIVILGGLRSTFDWQENYIRFSGVREAVEAERRSYTTGAAPYSDPATRDQLLVAAVSRIEQEEMNAWFKIAADQPRQ